MSQLQRGMFRAPAPPSGHRAGPKSTSRDLSPLPWSDYFEEKSPLTTPGTNDVFNIYRSGREGPVVFCLHGAGYSGLTWATMTKELRKLVECQVVAPDLRGHGDTHTENDTSLGCEQQCKDIALIAHCLFGDIPPPIVLVGHSMGGAIAIHATHGRYLPVTALIVIDVVEGTAMESLGHMHTVLASRPRSFNSLAQAMDWCIRSGTAHNTESCRVSMPGQLRPLTLEDITKKRKPSRHEMGGGIQEEDETQEREHTETSVRAEGDGGCVSAPTQADIEGKYTWRADLAATEPYWSEWFADITRYFLEAGAFKLLLLAGIDRLDRDMTIGQMQGKYQLKILPKVGHAVQEDAPAQVADTFAEFMVRFKIAAPTDLYKRPLPFC